MHRGVRILLGLVFWLGLGTAAVWAVRWGTPLAEGTAANTGGRLWQAIAARGRWLSFENARRLPLRVGDPVYQEAEPGRLVHVGHVYALVDEEGKQHLHGKFPRGVVYLTPEARLQGGVRLEHYRADLSIAAGVQMLFPPEKRQQVQRLLVRHWQQQRREMLDTLRPVIEHTLKQTLAVLQEDLARELRRREPQLRQLARRWEKSVLERHLLPVLQEEVFPLAQREATPLAREIGMELWDRVSLWRFGTAALLDSITSGNRVDQEFDQFLQQEAIPLLKRRSRELVHVARRIMQQALQRPNVRRALQRGLEALADDEQFRRLLWEVFEQVVVNNPRLHRAVQQAIASPETQQALRHVARNWEPVAQQIGALLLGTPEQGLTPELTRLLRLHVFGKDRRWLVLSGPGTGMTQAAALSAPPESLELVAGTRRDLVPPVPESPGVAN